MAICGRKLPGSDDICGLKPGHEEQKWPGTNEPVLCIAKQFTCSRQHIGGTPIGCGVCLGEDLAQVRTDLLDAQKDIASLIQRGRKNRPSYLAGLAGLLRRAANYLDHVRLSK